MTAPALTPHAPARAPAAPVADRLVVAAVLVAGIAAAHLAMPALWIVTPLVAGTLLVASVRGVRRADVAARTTPLAPRLERSIAEALGTVPAGDVRDLLREIVSRARALVGAYADQPDERRLTRDVADLVEACCDIAREHAKLDAVLPAVWEPVLAPAAARGTADDSSADELRRRGDAGRDLLTRRLREAAAVISEMLVQRGVERSGAAAERVAELTSELAAEAAARRHATQEIQRVLSR